MQVVRKNLFVVPKVNPQRRTWRVSYLIKQVGISLVLWAIMSNLSAQNAPYQYLTINIYSHHTKELLASDVTLYHSNGQKKLSMFKSNSADRTHLVKIAHLPEFILHVEKGGFSVFHKHYHIKRLVHNPCFVYEANDSTLVFNMELLRPGTGEFLNFDIRFYNNSQVMLSSSKPHLEALVEMMKENPDMEIRIHGHTTSSRMGKFKTLENPQYNSLRFFDNNPKNETKYGTANKLSEMRAESVKLYLQTRGIKAHRIKIKGWGSSHKLYEGQKEEYLKKNMRVEVEVIAD